MNKNQKNAIIWRKSIHDRDYICKCGKELMKNGEVVNDVLYDTKREELICPNCMWTVAKITTYDYAIKNAFKAEEA